MNVGLGSICEKRYSKRRIMRLAIGCCDEAVILKERSYYAVRYRTGIPWRDLPERYGDWKATHKRLRSLGTNYFKNFFASCALIYPRH